MKIARGVAEEGNFAGSAVILTAYACENNADKMSALPFTQLQLMGRNAKTNRRR